MSTSMPHNDAAGHEAVVAAPDAAEDVVVEAENVSILTANGSSLNAFGQEVRLNSRRRDDVSPQQEQHVNPDAVQLQCRWASSIYNYDSNSVIHSSIKSLDLQDGRWIECQCKSTKILFP